MFFVDVFTIHLQTTLKETKHIWRKAWQKLWSASAYQSVSWAEMLQGFLPFLRSDCPSPEKAMNLFTASSLKHEGKNTYAGIYVKQNNTENIATVKSYMGTKSKHDISYIIHKFLWLRPWIPNESDPSDFEVIVGNTSV